MSNAIEPGDAGRALEEIGRREGQVIDAAIVPAWYWWVVAAASVGLGVVVDGHSATAITLAAVVYALGIAALTAWVIVGGVRRVKVSEALLGPEGAALIVGFVGIIVVGTIALAFVLRAAGSSMPATSAPVACGAAPVVRGPVLLRRL